MPLRADEFLAKHGFAESRSKARALIEEGKVLYASKVVDKPSRKLEDPSLVEVSQDALALRYVSRAGLKLEKFLDEFSLDVRGCTALDAGASTGGFTDCLLQRGAKRVFCVDVGSGQLHKKILADPRAVNVENTDIRSVSCGFFIEKFPEFFADGAFEGFGFICADLSFISLEKVAGGLYDMLKGGGKMVCLIKPQFEAGIAAVKRAHGVLKDADEISACVESVRNFAARELTGAKLIGLIESPVKGGDGNTEYLMGLEKLV